MFTGSPIALVLFITDHRREPARLPHRRRSSNAASCARTACSGSASTSGSSPAASCTRTACICSRTCSRSSSSGSRWSGASGRSSFLLLYLIALVLADIGTCLKHRNNPDYASLGASGAILGVMFASIVYFPTQSLILFPIPLPIPAPLFAVGYLAYSYWQSRSRTWAASTTMRTSAARSRGWRSWG